MPKDTSIFDFDEKEDLSIFDWKDESHKKKRRKSVIRPRKTAKKKTPPKKKSPPKKRKSPKKKRSAPKKTARQSLAEAVRRTPRRKKKKRKTVARKRLSTIQEGSHEESSIASSIFRRK